MGSRRNRRKRLQKERLKELVADRPIPERIDPTPHLDYLRSIGLHLMADTVAPLIEQKLRFPENGDVPKWITAVNALPELIPTEVTLNTGTITLTPPKEFQEIHALRDLYMELRPWRKGPFSLMGVAIDTEWRSDWKWERLNLPSLQDKKILDVGCGSGYHCLRMLGEGAVSVTGIDPSWVSYFQFQTIQHFLKDPRVAVLPLKDTDILPVSDSFDMVFSMGVIYHQKSPVDHLRQLRALLVDEGTCVIETLIIESPATEFLHPQDRYGKMRNVFAIPSPSQLEEWLKEAGFSDIQLLDITQTTTDEQRATEWMQFESLTDFLDPEDRTKTIEGYPAPVRGAWIATKR